MTEVDTQGALVDPIKGHPKRLIVELDGEEKWYVREDLHLAQAAELERVKLELSERDEPVFFTSNVEKATKHDKTMMEAAMAVFANAMITTNSTKLEMTVSTAKDGAFTAKVTRAALTPKEPVS